jgi:hypothetical protein
MNGSLCTEVATSLHSIPCATLRAHQFCHVNFSVPDRSLCRQLNDIIAANFSKSIVKYFASMVARCLSSSTLFDVPAE